MTKANDEFKKYIYQNSPFKAIYSEHAQYGKFKITKFLAAIIREEFGLHGWKENISYQKMERHKNLIESQKWSSSYIFEKDQKWSSSYKNL